MISELEKRVQRYWTQRSHDFGTVRRNELEDEMGRKWFRELEKHLPENGKLKVLDVGTGTGFFAVLLAQAGHRVEGVDLTPAMLEEARALAAQRGLDITFREMDAQALDYEDGCFDAVISRNLTWTLPDPERAYGQWSRVLKPGGTFFICNEANGETAKDDKWTKIINGMTIYTDADLKVYLEQAGFGRVQSHKNKKGWLCVTAQK